MTPDIHTIDATDKALGRVASEAALCLRGKRRADFTPHLMPKVKVVVVNASKLALDQRKKAVEYRRYSGYPGGLKSTTLDRIIERRGYGEAVRLAVRGMLPANKLRPQIMKNLTVQD